MDGDIINKWIDDSLNDSLSIENINSDDEYIPSPDDSNSEEDCILSPNPKRRRLCKRLFDADDTDKTSSEAQTNNTDPALENEGSYSSVCDVSPTVNQSGKINRSLVPYSETESEKDSTSDELTPMKEKKKTRKRQRNPKNWKKNVRKERRQTGRSYTSSCGKIVPQKNLQHLDCKCKFKCSNKVSKDEREAVMLSYYKIDQNEKYHFILRNTECKMSVRTKVKNNPQKKNSFSYFLHINNEKIRVCKQFFLQTILVSQKTIYNVHNNKDKSSEVPKSDERGKKTKDRTQKADKDILRKHIESFAKVESHYCRAKTAKEYLSPDLNISRMFDMYLEHCKELKVKPLSISMYRSIFNNEYNLDFLLPKSDRCDLCEEYSMSLKENRMTEELAAKYDDHMFNKTFMRNERKKDRESNEVVVCFDLQNVIALPRANVSCFFYKRKLNVYNLTAHCSKDKKGYCAFWHEALCGRSGNDIASAVVKIMEKISSAFPDVKDYILWSDSCVPQNRNSVISYAISLFMAKNKHIERVTMKYSTPGHSCIQEVDNVHSNIEKALKVTEVWSPVSLLRVIIASNKKSPYSVIQMLTNDFFDFQAQSKNLAYQDCPYTKVCQLQFCQSNLLSVKFKTSHDPLEPWNCINLVKKNKSNRSTGRATTTLPRILWGANVVRDRKKLPSDKIKDIKSMMKWMPTVD
ncbi:uncharacterized protein LOC124370146 [Homalodisca vitripennis]|nr:uncharacterized protein LOC124370146 [Homalodisca vitripennis]